MRRYLRLDVDQGYCYVHLRSAGEGQERALRFPNTAEGWAAFLEHLGSEDVVMVEVSSGPFRFYEMLADKAGQVVIVDARVMGPVGSRKRKTDRDGKEVLAEHRRLQSLRGGAGAGAVHPGASGSGQIQPRHGACVAGGDAGPPAIHTDPPADRGAGHPPADRDLLAGMGAGPWGRPPRGRSGHVLRFRR